MSLFRDIPLILQKPAVKPAYVNDFIADPNNIGTPDYQNLTWLVNLFQNKLNTNLNPKIQSLFTLACAGFLRATRFHPENRLNLNEPQCVFIPFTNGKRQYAVMASNSLSNLSLRLPYGGGLIVYNWNAYGFNGEELSINTLNYNSEPAMLPGFNPSAALEHLGHLRSSISLPTDFFRTDAASPPITPSSTSPTNFKIEL